jgi:hypothetical protein
MPATYLSQERWNDDRVDFRDKRKPRAKAPRDKPEDTGPKLSRYGRGANRILMTLAYQDVRRGTVSKPMGEALLPQLLAMKADIVGMAETAEAQGNPWADDEFVDICKTGFEKLLLG